MSSIKRSRKLHLISIKDIAYIAVFIALITICSWISIPMPVPFTLQLLAVFLAVYLLGPINSFITILLYLLMGIVGIPVFASFKAGFSIFLSPTGGFLIGFLTIPLIYLPFYILNKRGIGYLVSMIIGLLLTYLIGSICFIYIYKAGQIDLKDALLITVVPFIIPDISKLIIAFILGKKLKKFVNLE